VSSCPRPPSETSPVVPPAVLLLLLSAIASTRKVARRRELFRGAESSEFAVYRLRFLFHTHTHTFTRSLSLPPPSFSLFPLHTLSTLSLSLPPSLYPPLLLLLFLLLLLLPPPLQLFNRRIHMADLVFLYPDTSEGELPRPHSKKRKKNPSETKTWTGFKQSSGTKGWWW